MTGYNSNGDVATSNGNHNNSNSNGTNGNSNGHSKPVEYTAQELHTKQLPKVGNFKMCSRDCCSKQGGANNKAGNSCLDKKGGGGHKEELVVPTPQSLLYPYEVIQEIADFIVKRAGIRPKIGIICGSGLGSLADIIQDAKVFEYEKIPNFPVSTVEGHAGKLVVGTLEGANVMAMQGRFHFYEGYPLAKCSMPVRVMKLCGVEYLFATNAAGGINPKFNVGDIMLMHDHVNMLGFAGNSPLQGPNDPRFGPRFPALVNSYNRDLINKAIEIGKTMGIESNIHVGVYSCLGGPTYETIAELKALRMMGVDAVGMSTVHEVITARHCDMKVFAFSLITNKCPIEYSDKKDEEANHEEVMAVAKNRQKACCELVSRLICEIQKGS
ncbi:purine nucleoside phosphorylase isoform X1 [Drosophila sulfurigaster albostrigata]|uniref:Purine nucleoside phosphorylase n=1 Tax=Drosophila albomicans TaxID=7291 RepID=A0A9C6SNZ2_DROAB|nr:purine nucleoside phosphorylase isoform X1 [Drosophila albomicans]XP_062129153.1 purine nucleoside phosphorylase isoform X1 [Drosophila sulfurigaster albostrigata]